MSGGFALKTVYITDRDDAGKLFGHLVGSLEEDEILVDILVAPHLVVLSDDGLTRNGVPEVPDADALASVQESTKEAWGPDHPSYDEMGQ